MSRIVSCGEIRTLNEVPITVVTVSSIWLLQLRSIVSKLHYALFPQVVEDLSICRRHLQVIRLASDKPSAIMFC